VFPDGGSGIGICHHRCSPVGGTIQPDEAAPDGSQEQPESAPNLALQSDPRHRGALQDRVHFGRLSIDAMFGAGG